MSKLKISLLFLFFHASLFSLTLEEKVGQLLIVHFHGFEANEEARYLIQECHVGGIVYYSWANSLNSPEQVKALSGGLQKLAQVPLFIAVDQEGGCVNRLKECFTVFPGNYALGLTGEKKWGHESALIMAQELKSVGITMNLAPVVDVFSQPSNPVIGIRAFSSNPQAVADWGKVMLQGFQEGGIIATLKHFPGHGDVQVDSHVALPVVSKTMKELISVEFLPFRRLVKHADVIMTAHLMVPALDSQQCVTFSSKVLNYLRKEMGFEGVILTDSMAMEGILSQGFSIEEAVLKSVLAGHDLILLGGKQLNVSQKGLEFSKSDVKRIHSYLVAAVQSGRLPLERVDEAVTRILALKEKYGQKSSNFKTIDSKKLVLKIAKKALHLIKGEEYLPIPLNSSFLVVAPANLEKEIAETFLCRNPQFFYQTLNPSQSEKEKILALAAETSQCIFFAYNAWQHVGQQQLHQALSERCALTTLIVRDPIDAQFLTSADVLLCTHSPALVSIQTALHKLFNNF